MKFIHLSDLHLGIRFKEVSFIEDQTYILKKIIQIVDEVKPDGVLMSGDIYDKSIPSAEAVALFDDFLYSLAKRDLQVFVISGNHDSAERVAFGGRLMDLSGVHMSPVYKGQVEPIVMKDAHGPVNVYMLPFIKPVHVRQAFKDVEVKDYTDALAVAIQEMNVDQTQRNVLLSHQFVTGAMRSDSEEINVGGLDNVNAQVYDPFDYVALGHIHSPQKAGRESVRYCGTPLKYSFSEVNDTKSVTVVTLEEKGKVLVDTIPLIPMRDMRVLEGSYDELTERSFVEQQKTDDYLRVVLTDEEERDNAFAILRNIYSSILSFEYNNTRTRATGYVGDDVEIENKSALELFSEFYELQNGQAMSEEQTAFMTDLIEKIWEGKA